MTTLPINWKSTIGQLAEMMGDHPLPMSLMMAVPLVIVDISRAGGTTEEDRQFSRDFAAALEQKVNVLIYGSDQAGEAAQIFNDLARAIAITAFEPGGVQVGGSEFVAVKQGQKVKKAHAPVK